MAPPAPKADEAESEDWLTTYADAITLLMAFFVMLVSFSKIDLPMFEEVAAGIRDKIGAGGSANAEKTPMKVMKLDLESAVMTMQVDDAVKIGSDSKGIVIELASSAFYKPGSADILDAAIPVLAELHDVLASPRYRTFMIEVEGHTDDDPISTVRYPSNWELSAGRASQVVRFFVEAGMDMKRMKASAYAETRPKVPNRTADGAPIRENQATNRRVEVRVFPMSLEEQRTRQRKVDVDALDAEKGPAEGEESAPTFSPGPAPEATMSPGPVAEPTLSPGPAPVPAGGT